MNKFEQLLKNDKYQVFLFHSVCNFPAWFATHPWFVINERGNVSRYEGRFVINKDGRTIHRNAMGAFEGLGLNSVKSKYKWPTRLDGLIEGGANSEAFNMIQIIKSSTTNYPYLDRSKPAGPNSNTYAQWILDQAPNFPGRLKWNAIGKTFRNPPPKPE